MGGMIAAVLVGASFNSPQSRSYCCGSCCLMLFVVVGSSAARNANGKVLLLFIFNFAIIDVLV